MAEYTVHGQKMAVRRWAGAVMEVGRGSMWQAEYGKVPEHASIARRQQDIFVGRKEKI